MGIASSATGSVRFFYVTHRTYGMVKAQCTGGGNGGECTWADTVWKVEYHDLKVGWPTGASIETAEVGGVPGYGFNPSAATLAVDSLGQVHVGLYEPSDTGEGSVVKYALIGPTP